MSKMYAESACLSTQNTLIVNKVCHPSDLEKVSFVILENTHVPVSGRAKIVLSLFISVSKLGYSEIHCPIGKIISVLESRIGQSISERSMFRYLSEIESQSIIHRHKYRAGKDRFNTKIQLDPGFFSYWSRKKTHKVTPIPTCDHTSSQLPKWQESAWTEDNPRVNTEYSSSSVSERDIHNRPRGRACDQYTKRRKRENPLIYSCRHACKGRRDARFIIARATWELRVGQDISGHSGVDWEYWGTRWNSFGKAQKDATMSGQILPLLANRSTLHHENFVNEFARSLLGQKFETLPTTDRGETFFVQDEPIDTKPFPDMSPEEVRRAIREIAKPIDSEGSNPVNPVVSVDSLSDDERRILESASLRVKARGRLR